LRVLLLGMVAVVGPWLNSIRATSSKSSLP
jgi:hypothetical protein